MQDGLQNFKNLFSDELSTKFFFFISFLLIHYLRCQWIYPSNDREIVTATILDLVFDFLAVKF
jgi:hypothetical protein